MRGRYPIIAAVFAGLFLLALAQPAAAEWITLDPQSTLPEEVEGDADGMITVTWHAGDTIQVVLRDPSGTVLRSVTDYDYSFTEALDVSGTYTIEWINPQTDAVSVDKYVFGVDVSPEHILTAIGWIIVIAVVGIIAVIVIIVLLFVFVLNSEIRHPQQASPPMTYLPAPPAPSGWDATDTGSSKCPLCRSPIDSSMAFCQRCGAKLR